jgi:hypothetical protein
VIARIPQFVALFPNVNVFGTYGKLIRKNIRILLKPQSFRGNPTRRPHLVMSPPHDCNASNPGTVQGNHFPVMLEMHVVGAAHDPDIDPVY